jgi:histidinol-phosphate aminotransferase
VFRTFSKAWGLAGLRCGYAIGGPESEPLLEQLEPELGVNELAQAGALEALRHGDVVARRVAVVSEQRERIVAALPDLGLEAPPSQANFVWLRADAIDGGQLVERLQRGHVIVAPGAALGDPERVRVAVQGPQATDRLLRALELAHEG